MKLSKKLEGLCLILDIIEQVKIIGPDGNETPGWVILKNVQFKHVNVCMNEIGDDIKDTLINVLRRTNDDFGVTLSGNPVTKEIIDHLQKVALETHHHRINSQPHDPNSQPQLDAQIGLKRIAF